MLAKLLVFTSVAVSSSSISRPLCDIQSFRLEAQGLALELHTFQDQETFKRRDGVRIRLPKSEVREAGKSEKLYLTLGEVLQVQKGVTQTCIMWIEQRGSSTALRVEEISYGENGPPTLQTELLSLGGQQ